MIFETLELPERFTPWIESVFHYRDFEPDHSIERVVPTGHVFVIFELDGFERHTYDNETLEPNANFRSAWVSGIHRNYLSISAHQKSEMFVIQFCAYGAHPFLHEPMHRLADRVVPAADLLDGELLALRESLLAGGDSTQKFAVAEDWLAKRFDKRRVPPKPVVDVVHRLQAEPAAKLNEVLDTWSGSQKHLIDQFKKYIGLTPKLYQRVLRFNDVFVQMQGDQFLSWSDIAYRCGYSDQSHFIREFKHFSGFNPERYLREDFADDATNFFPLDRDG